MENEREREEKFRDKRQKTKGRDEEGSKPKSRCHQLEMPL